jgi:hypothetical protein
MQIASVASAFPEYYYKQEVLTEALKNDWRHRLPNPDILDRLDESMQVEGRYLVHPIEFYINLNTWGTWRKGAVQGAARSGNRRKGFGGDFRNVGDGNCGAVAGCAFVEPHGHVAEYQENSDLRAGMRGGSGWNFACSGLCEGVSGSGGGAFVG